MQDLVTFTKPLRLLFVEDDDMLRETTCSLFEEMFDYIVTAVNGVDGLEKFQKEDFDLVITDITMPKMDGTEMLTKIRESGSEVPFIMLTAHNDLKYLMHTAEQGVHGYIKKPLQLESFTEILFRLQDAINIKNQKPMHT